MYIGIIIKYNSNHNHIYHNNFIYNNVNAYDFNSNIWDDEENGNYWDDYEKKYPNASNNGMVWLTPYDIDGAKNKDLYPSVNSFGNIEDDNQYYNRQMLIGKSKKIKHFN